MFNYRRQRSWGKVMFLHLSVILFTGGCLADAPRAHPPRHTPPGHTPAGHTPHPGTHPPRHTPPLGTHPLGTPPLDRHTLGRYPSWVDTPQGHGHCSGRYASYWNAYLFSGILVTRFNYSHTTTSSGKDLLKMNSELSVCGCGSSWVFLL